MEEAYHWLLLHAKTSGQNGCKYVIVASCDCEISKYPVRPLYYGLSMSNGLFLAKTEFL